MFGFTGAATRSGDPEKDLERASALGSSLLVFLIVPWTLCLIAYSFLHLSYPRDKRHAAQAAQAETADGAVNGHLASAGSGLGDSEDSELIPKDRRRLL